MRERRRSIAPFSPISLRRFRDATGRGYDLLWAFAPATADFPALVGAADGYFAQEGADWTERQRHIFRWTAAHGYDQTVLIASDSPQLPARTVSAAFAALDGSMAVARPDRMTAAIA